MPRPRPFRHRLAAVALLALVLGCASTATAHAATHVDVSSRGGACSDARSAAQAASPATPWCSLATAIDKAPSGSTVLVRQGSYPFARIDGTDFRHARNTATVTLRPFPGEAPEISALELRNLSHLRFEGLRFTGSTTLVYFGNDHISFVGNDMTRALHVRGSSDILVEGNRFHDGRDSCEVDSSDAGGVRAFGGTQRLTVRDNRFERLTGDAIQMDGTGVLIENNTFDHIQVAPGCGAHTDVIQSLGADEVTIRGNVARDSDSGILNSSADSQTHGWTIENNVIVRSSGTPLQLDNQMDDLVVTNNTFDGCGVAVLFRWWSQVAVNSQGFVIANNVFGDGYSVDSRLRIALADYNLVPAGAPRRGAHDVAADPRFADPSANRYDLRAGSPAIDSGLGGRLGTISGAAYVAPALDGLGRTRADGRPDRGALEYGAAAADPVAPAPADPQPPQPDPDPVVEPAPAETVPAPAPSRTTPATVTTPPAAPKPAPRLTAVRLPSLAPSRRARVKLRFALDRSATVTIAVTGARRRALRRTTVRGRAGVNEVALAALDLRRPGRYRVQVTATAGGAMRAVSQVLRVGGR